MPLRIHSVNMLYYQHIISTTFLLHPLNNTSYYPQTNSTPLSTPSINPPYFQHPHFSRLQAETLKDHNQVTYNMSGGEINEVVGVVRTYFEKKPFLAMTV